MYLLSAPVILRIAQTSRWRSEPVRPQGVLILGARYLADVRFRTDVNLYRSIVINALYIVLKLFLGLTYRAYCLWP